MAGFSRSAQWPFSQASCASVRVVYTICRAGVRGARRCLLAYQNAHARTDGRENRVRPKNSPTHTETETQHGYLSGSRVCACKRVCERGNRAMGACANMLAELMRRMLLRMTCHI